MERGDIAVPQAQRFLFVFDGFLGKLPKKKLLAYKALLKVHQWERAFYLWDMVPKATDHLNRIYWQYNLRFDIVTWQPQAIANEIEEWCARINLPVGYVSSTTSEKLARELAHMPDVVKVFDADPDHKFRYGQRGRWLDDNTTFSIFT